MTHCGGIMLLTVSGCTTKAYTISVDNGDKIKLTLETTDKYDISSDVPFAIFKEGTVQTQGTFIQGISIRIM